MRMDVDQKLIGTIPVELIDNFLNCIDEEDWSADDYRNSAGNMSSTNSIPLLHTPLCFPTANIAAIETIEKRVLYPKFENVFLPILNHLKTFYEFKFCSAFVARLNPLSKIEEHIDSGSFLRTCHRVHIPLKTNEDVKYVINGKSYFWEKGNIYEFSNNLMHGVINDSNEYRIHLVINLYNLTDEDLQTIKELEEKDPMYFWD